MRLSLLAFLLPWVVSCIGARPLETATVMPVSSRRPDGVVLEPASALPPPADRAAANGVVALREPLADKDVEDVIRAYLRAFEREDIDALVQLLAHDATPLGRPGGRAQLIELWRTKIKNFEYQKLVGIEVARIAQIERHGYESLPVPAASGAATSNAPTRPQSMRPGDLHVRVPIATPRVGTEQLFGDVLVLLLRREDGRLKIAGQADESAP